MDPKQKLLPETEEKDKPPGWKTPRVKISSQINEDNFKIRILDKLEYSVNYPAGIFSKLKKKDKEVLLDNLIYTKTAPLGVLNQDRLYYQASKPLLKDFVDDGVVKDLSRISEVSNQEYKKLLNNFKNSQGNESIFFQNNNSTEKLIPLKKASDKVAVLGLSFGKDSLLSFGLAKEIGLECHLVFINDMEKYNPNEFKQKEKIVKEFSKERQPVFSLTDETDNIFRTKEITRNKFKNVHKLDMTNAMLFFALELIPLAYFHQAKYIIFGNERDYSDFFLNKERSRVYHAYDQSRGYTRRKNYYLRRLTKNLQVVSLIEPLYNIAEMKILSHRYPELLKYVMSCSNDKLTNEKWCSQCEVCAEMFLYSAAVNSNPRKIGIEKNLFKKKYERFYPLFAPDKSPAKIYEIYRIAPSGIDEQLLAYLLAYRNGYKGELIDLFKTLYLKEAEKREKELRKRFFGIHPTHMPKELKEKVIKIYKQELQSLT